MRSSAFSWNLLMMICPTTIILLSLMSLHEVMCARPCLSHQQSLMVQLNNSFIFGTNFDYENFDYEDFDYKAPQWNLSTDCCTWEGVTCEEGRIIGLDLSRKSIVGGLTDNSGLFHFQYLRSLDLSHNHFHGTPIPSRLGNLTSLTHLNLSSSGFVGPIPFELSRLTNLSTIQLDHNPFSAPVPRFLANFSKLTFLSLIECDLHGTFPKEIFQVPTLETINLTWNELLQGSLPEFSLNNSLQNLALGSSSFSGRLPSSINNLSKLSTLYLSACHFNETLPNFILPELVYLNLDFNIFIGPIPSFRFSKKLEMIGLFNNRLSGAIPPAHWEGLPNLVYVDLGNILFNGTLPTSLFRVPSLRVISLSHNQFSGQLPEFPNASSSILESIDLSGNNLEGPIPQSMFQLKKLIDLSLSFNKLNGTIQLHVVKGLVGLNYLDLSYNNLSVEANDTTWSSLPMNITGLYLASCKLKIIPHLKNQSKLWFLDLSDNGIQGAVPNWIWDLGLDSLNLSRNYLTGIQEPYALPSSLNFLDLHSNQIRGKMPTIPRPIQYIDFSSNNFDSSLPAEIGNEHSFSYGLAIIYLSLSHNGITGVIPESICSMSSLQLLDLSSNNLTGRIPECMSSMESLGVLNLRRNRLSGVIPASFPVDCRLKTLDLNGNSLQEQLPKSLANCTELEVLDLGNNNLIDKFPCFLENISALHVLILRSNKFHGSIGCSNANDTWAKLQIIDLAHNSFSGELSRRNFTKWKAMMSGGDDAQRKLNHLQVELSNWWYYEDSTTITLKGHDMYLMKILTIDICIDFSSNNFSGQIPEELGALALLYVLNLSNNAFSGPIPSSLGKLQSLEALDLSRNQLNGTIPTLLANLNFLSHLDLSFNKLVGRIPSGSQFQTFEANSFQGNQGLCGFPSTTNCTDDGAQDHSTPAEDNHSDNSQTKIDWNIISVEIGFIVGLVSIIGPLVFCKRLREMFFETMEDVAYRILPLSVTRKWLSWTTAR